MGDFVSANVERERRHRVMKGRRFCLYFSPAQREALSFLCGDSMMNFEFGNLGSFLPEERLAFLEDSAHAGFQSIAGL